MASEVEVVNSALVKIGAQRITALDEGTRNANEANEQYPKLRDMLLRSHTWNFATRRKKLARSARTPSHEFDHQYPVPSDYMRTVIVADNDAGRSGVAYKIGYDPDDGTVILSSADELWLTYIAKVTDPNEMPPDFREALAFLLAREMATILAQSNTLSELMSRRYDDALLRARSTDGIEDSPPERPEGSWVTARR